MKSLCLNMLVKNQKDAVERCLNGAAPFVTSWIIADAGSTDGTQEFVRSFFAARNIPGELHQLVCNDFAEGRREALDRARSSNLAYDYLLLMEADADWGEQGSDHLATFAYKVVPRSKEIYFNSRLFRRSAMNQWQEDISSSLLNVARTKEARGYAKDEILAAYSEAAEACTTRAEALHGAARFCRINGLCQSGYEFAVKGLKITRPVDGSLSEAWIYDYGLLDELAVNAYWAGRYRECVDACDRLVSEGKIPANQRERISKNKSVAEFKQKENLEVGSNGQSKVLDHDGIYARFLREMEESLVDQKLTMGFWAQTCEQMKHDAITGNKFDFLRWPSLTVFSVPESHIGPKCYSDLRSSPEWESKWFNLTRDRMVGTPRNFSRDFGTSPILIQHAHHLYRYETATGRSLIDTDVVFEVGGGYGSFCRLLGNYGFKGTHIIYDLPHVRSIQRLFLSLNGFDEITNLDGHDSRHGFKLISDPELDDVFEVIKLKGLRVAFVATWSLSEMPLQARDRLFPRLHDVCDRYLIAFQREFINLNDTRNNVRNTEYFDNLRVTQSGVNWHVENLDSRNQYLFA